MPREGVPYPERMLCSLKCELKNIWTALSGKLHSVNGVEGDGAGNVNIVSGDAAVVVTTDPSLNQIEVSLDQSQLPAAAVSSVNGETGAVVLDASEIGSSGSSDVQTDIDALKAADVTLQGNITAEATARGNADSTLQTNINSVNASVANKVDKLTTAGPHVYTHYGNTQGELKYSSAIDYNSVAVRDNAGRFKVEDPVSGDTSKNVVTANWVSQTGNSSPNNLIHKTGVETFKSDKNFGDSSSPDAASIILWSSGAYRRFRMRSSIDDYSVTPATNIAYGLINFSDMNDQTVANIILNHKATGGYRMDITLRKSDGTTQVFTLGETS